MSDNINIEPVAFEWTTTQSEGVTAQSMDSVIDLGSSVETITISGAGPTYTMGSTAGAVGASSYNWNSSGITITDPYEEMEKRLTKLEAIIEEEQRIRDECPAVRNAYDEYRFLLVLAKRNNGDLLTDNS
jgi:hypothetical protein